MNRPADAALPVSSNRRFLLDLSPILPPGRSLTSLLIVLAPHPHLSGRRRIAAQVSRAMKVKHEYLTKTQHELGSKREQAESHAEGGILGLNLLKAVQEGQKA